MSAGRHGSGRCSLDPAVFFDSSMGTMADAYRQRADEVLAGLGVDPRRGLTEAEAQARLARTAERADGRAAGPGVAEVPRAVPGRAGHPAAVATAVSAGLWLYERDTAAPVRGDRDPRGRAPQRRDGLRAGVARRVGRRRAARDGGGPGARLRDGERRSIPAADVVPGDILLVEEGDTIPADARVIAVDRAADRRSRADGREPARLEGPGRRSPRRPALGDRHNMVFSGTAATYGRGTRGRGRDRDADRDGAHRRACCSDAPSETTPLQKELDRTRQAARRRGGGASRS